MRAVIGTIAVFWFVVVRVGPVWSSQLFEGRCHMDYCSWFSVEEKDLIGTSPKGALFRTVTKAWSSYHPNGSYNRKTRRTGGQEIVGYVFCSKTEPALIYRKGTGAWSAIMLTPYNPYGAIMTSLNVYFVLCHGIYRVGADYDTDARRFGYPITNSDDTPDDAELARPEDFLKR